MLNYTIVLALTAESFYPVAKTTTTTPQTTLCPSPRNLTSSRVSFPTEEELKDAIADAMASHAFDRDAARRLGWDLLLNR